MHVQKNTFFLYSCRWLGIPACLQQSRSRARAGGKAERAAKGERQTGGKSIATADEKKYTKRRKKRERDSSVLSLKCKEKYFGKIIQSKCL